MCQFAAKLVPERDASAAYELAEVVATATRNATKRLKVAKSEGDAHAAKELQTTYIQIREFVKQQLKRGIQLKVPNVKQRVMSHSAFEILLQDDDFKTFFDEL